MGWGQLRVFQVWSWAVLTVLQRGGVDLAGRGPRARAVERLHHHPVLRKLLEVVQRVDLAVPRGLHLHDAVLPVAARAVLPVANLVATDHPVLQLLLGGLRDNEGRTEQCHRGDPCAPTTSPQWLLSRLSSCFPSPLFKIVIKKVQCVLGASREESAAWTAPVPKWSRRNPKSGSLKGQIEINLNNISLKH